MQHVTNSELKDMVNRAANTIREEGLDASPTQMARWTMWLVSDSLDAEGRYAPHPTIVRMAYEEFRAPTEG